MQRSQSLCFDDNRSNFIVFTKWVMMGPLCTPVNFANIKSVAFNPTLNTHSYWRLALDGICVLNHVQQPSERRKPFRTLNHRQKWISATQPQSWSRGPSHYTPTDKSSVSKLYDGSFRVNRRYFRVAATKLLYCY